MTDNICQEGVYNEIFEVESEKVRNYLYYKTGDLALSEDLLQEAFIKLWKNCAKVTFGKAKAYLYTISNNLFIDQSRRQKVRLSYKKQVSSNPIEVKSPDFLLEEQEFKNRLESAINELPENERIVFLMNRIDKKKYREIAEEIGISIKAVEKRMHKALLHLRRIHKKV